AFDRNLLTTGTSNWLVSELILSIIEARDVEEV
ncbi:hypothetical protein MJO29_009171, partial [Puccinia striiformis f. sp. tritici]